MNGVMFYQPSSTSTGQPSWSPAPTASIIPKEHLASPSVRQSQLNQQSEIWTKHTIKCQDMSNFPQQGYFSDQFCRNDLIQEKERLAVTQNPPNNNLPYIPELQSSIQQNSILASENPKSDDDNGFIDIDELLAGMKEESISTGVEPNSSDMAEKVNNETRGDSPIGSTCSSGESTQNSIMLSNNKPLATESETDYSDVDLGLTAKSDTDSPRVADSKPADSNSFGSGSTFTFGRLVSDHKDEDSNNNNISDNAKVRLATDYLHLSSAPPSLTFATHQASKIQVNTDIAQGTTSSVNLDATKEVEDEGFDVFTNGSDKQDQGQNNSTFDSSISAHNSSRDHAQPVQLDLAAAHQQLDPTTESLPAAHRTRQSAPKYARYKHPRSSSSLRLASAASATSTIFKSTNLEIRQPRTSVTDPSQERQLSDFNSGTTNDLNDEDYVNQSDASSNAIKGSPPSKRLRRTKDLSRTTYHDLEKDSNYSFELSNQDKVVASPNTMPQSEEIPIRGFLTLKASNSRVIYCFSFSQELSPQPSGTNVSKSDDRRDPERSPLPEEVTSTRVRHSKFSPEDDKLLRQLKEDECLSWDEIAEQFPERSKGTLQVHYSTKLKRRSGTSQKISKRRRSK